MTYLSNMFNNYADKLSVDILKEIGDNGKDIIYLHDFNKGIVGRNHNYIEITKGGGEIPPQWGDVCGRQSVENYSASIFQRQKITTTATTATVLQIELNT